METGFYNNIVGAATTTVHSGATQFRRIIVNTPVASGSITIYDSTTGSGTKIGTITLPATLVNEGPNYANYEVNCNIGLTIVTVGALDITVVWR